MSQQPVILITNDDGYRAKGLQALVEMAKPLGRIVSVAPEQGHSGMSHAITIKQPLRLRKRFSSDGVELYSVNGTPVDCVKLAMNQLFETPPNLILSGINHGSNSSVSIFYSGTMGATIEGCLYGIPSVGISLLNHDFDADFAAVTHFCLPVVKTVLSKGLPKELCLNINVPNLPASSIRGVRVCRQNRGAWREEFEKRVDPHGRDYYWLTGSFQNLEPNATDTDEYALANGYISVVPIGVDLTLHSSIAGVETLLNSKPIQNEIEVR